MHAPTKTSSPAVDISTPQVAVQPSLEESIPLEIHSSAATAHVVQEKTTLAEVFSFLSLLLESPF